MTDRVHAYGDDALADHDAAELVRMIAAREVSPKELADAAAARARIVDPQVNAIAVDRLDDPRYAGTPTGPFYGIPTFVKDNTDIGGMPTGNGSEAYTARPAPRDGVYTRQYLGTGMTLLGKTRLPEFGFNATTEFMTEPPVRNPWNLTRSVGASSGGSAALVAAGVVPVAHANDGGGSIRIPAACAGLVGLKPTRGRHIDGEAAKRLPINMISEGIVSRSVRDTAAFVAACEQRWRNPLLPPIGQVDGPADRRLRIGLVLDSVTGPVDRQTRAAVERTAAILEQAGHVITPIGVPVDRRFADDFVQYWGLLADLAVSTARFALDRNFDRNRIDGLTKGLRAHHRRHLMSTPATLRRLRRTPGVYAELFRDNDLVLSPTLAHVTPELGWIAPTVPFDTLLDRLMTYVAYTPLNNIAGSPAISIPAGLADEGVPIGVHFSAAAGDERSLIEIAYLLEQAAPFPRIQD